MKRLFVLVVLSTFAFGSLACKKGKKSASGKTSPASRKALKRGSATKGKTVTFDPKATKVGWTAYKYTRKAAVKGYFATFSATGATQGKTAHALLKAFSLRVDSASVKTGKPARDLNIATNFFKKFMGGPTINAKVVKVEGKNKGKLHVELSIHKLTKTVVFDYTLSAAGKLEANATIDMVKFGLKGPFASIEKACKGLHRGKDGKSKTWTDVQLHLTTQFAMK